MNLMCFQVLGMLFDTLNISKRHLRAVRLDVSVAETLQNKNARPGLPQVQSRPLTTAARIHGGPEPLL